VKKNGKEELRKEKKLLGLDKIDKVFILHLEKRKDRLGFCLKDLIPALPKYLQEKVEFFTAIDRTNEKTRNQRAAGCALSQAAIWKSCVERKYNRVLIFEDDVKPAVTPNELSEYFRFLKSMKFDLCALAYHPMAPFIPSKYKNFSHTHYFFHAAAYVAQVSHLSEMINTVEYNAGFLEKDYPISRHAIDVVWHKFHNNRHKKNSFKTWLISNLPLFVQRNRLYSDIEGRCKNNNPMKKNRNKIVPIFRS